jgi:hypothetical protein
MTSIIEANIKTAEMTANFVKLGIYLLYPSVRCERTAIKAKDSTVPGTINIK